MHPSEDELQRFFAEYREACPQPEASPEFLPQIWRRIEESQSFLFSFEHLARMFAAFAAAVCVVLLLLNVEARRTGQQPSIAPSYPEALALDQTAERTYYGEGIRGVVPAEFEQ